MNPTYQEMAMHYGMGVSAGSLPRCATRKFFAIEELNQAIRDYATVSTSDRSANEKVRGHHSSRLSASQH